MRRKNGKSGNGMRERTRERLSGGGRKHYEGLKKQQQ